MRKWRFSDNVSSRRRTGSPSHGLYSDQDNTMTNSHSFSRRTDVRGERSPRPDQSMLIKLANVSGRTADSVSRVENVKTASSRKICRSKFDGSALGNSSKVNQAPRTAGKTARKTGGKRRLSEPLNSTAADCARPRSATDSARLDSASGSDGSALNRRLDKRENSEHESFLDEQGIQSDVHCGETDLYNGRRIVHLPPAIPLSESERSPRRRTSRVVEFQNPVFLGLGDSTSSDIHSSSVNEDSLPRGFARCSSRRDSRLEGTSSRHVARECAEAASPRESPDSCTCSVSSARSREVRTLATPGARGTGSPVADCNVRPTSTGRTSSTCHLAPADVRQVCRSPTMFEEGGVGLVDPLAALTELSSDRRRVLGQCPCHTPDSGIGLTLDTILEEEDQVEEDWTPRAEYDFADSDDDWIVISPEGITETYRDSGQYSQVITVHGIGNI
ncbi:hypothetical protein RRG08_052956 [Elysia crispata]|uniref:Uncharacterized protein n=1 Tax=Elysia crispata TaxID=231223 RepID=A0AAE0ZKK3_9GAST|nr:hypothetical protein RRG08_052956 [Elysia crispata]